MRGDEPLARRLLFSSQAGASAPFHVLGKLAHGFFRNDAPCPSDKRSLSHVHRRQNFHAPALAFFPEGACFLRGFLGTPQTTGSYGLLNERGLVGRRFYFHAPKVRGLLFCVNSQAFGEHRQKSASNASAGARGKVANGLE